MPTHPAPVSDRRPGTDLISDRAAPAAARAHVADRVTGARAPDAVVECAQVLVGEVVLDALAGGVHGRVQIQVQPTPAGWAVLVEWRDEDAPPPDEHGYLPLAGTDHGSRRRRALLDRSPVRWRVTDDGLVTTVRIELDRPLPSAPRS